jgi:lysophospholipase L1-like esterase
VALGDSITVGEGQAMPGLPYRSWALWLAAALELPYSNFAVNGAACADVRDGQVPRLRGPYDLGCLYVGANDARGPVFDAAAYERCLSDVARALADAAERLCFVVVPLDLGRPRAGESVALANAAVRRVASAHGATIVANEDARGWRDVLPDAVHLTALGQVDLAERAAHALAADGTTVAVWPAAMAGLPLTRRALTRYALTGHAPSVLRDGRRRLREAAGRRIRGWFTSG